MTSDVRRIAAAFAAAAVTATLGALAVPATSAAAPAVTPLTAAQKAEVGGPLMASPGIVVSYPARGAWKLPKIPASAYLVANASTGAVLVAKDAHGLYPPASTLKLLTAITMLPRLNPTGYLKASKLAVSQVPNIVGLIRGHHYQVADLFRALLLISANDAAVTLVQGAGSFSRGMALLNAEAQHLQAYDVVAKLPNGLPAPGQVVSAYDLALIARQALAMPAFLKYDETLVARFPITRRKKVTLINQNYLLTQYKGGIGGKIGWTTAAKATYVGLARRNGVTLIVTILHCTPLEEITSAEKLLNWGFAMNSHVAPVGTLVPPLSAARPAPAPTGSPRPSPTATIAGASNALAGAGARNSRGGQLVVGAAIAAVLCVGLVGFVFRRRRSTAGDEK
jgi:D-alanyl-D-alanine carboxypeptidase (penicillin-binding protein 5/6)